MNREQRRAAGLKNGSVPILTITQEQIDQHMPGVQDGDTVQVTSNGIQRVMRVRIIAPSESATAKPH